LFDFTYTWPLTNVAKLIETDVLVVVNGVALPFMVAPAILVLHVYEVALFTAAMLKDTLVLLHNPAVAAPVIVPGVEGLVLLILTFLSALFPMQFTPRTLNVSPANPAPYVTVTLLLFVRNGKDDPLMVAPDGGVHKY
jgi:hypothetical protein